MRPIATVLLVLSALLVVPVVSTSAASWGEAPRAPPILVFEPGAPGTEGYGGGEGMEAHGHEGGHAHDAAHGDHGEHAHMHGEHEAEPGHRHHSH